MSQWVSLHKHILTDGYTVVVYTRAAASDYDDWENIFKNKGWGSESLIPLLKKVLIILLMSFFK